MAKGHARPAEILRDHTPKVRAIAERLRQIIHETVPEAIEAAHGGWHSIGYRHPRSGYFCGIFPQTDSVRPLLFYPKRDAQSAVNHELKRIGGKA